MTDAPYSLIDEAADAARQPPAQPKPGPLGNTNAAIQNYATAALLRAAAKVVELRGELSEDGVRVGE